MLWQASRASYQFFITTGGSPARFGHSYLSMQKCFCEVPVWQLPLGARYSEQR